jgi:hypothetical protein
LKKFTTDKFEIEKIGSSLITVKKVGIGNSIIITIKEIDELIKTLNKAKEEFK